MSPTRRAPDPRRTLPAVDRLVAAARRGAPELPDWALRSGAREALAAARERAGQGGVPALAALAREAEGRARVLARAHPRRVVNATGVVLHTNLGRALLAPEAADAAARAVASYSDLELDLDSGRRGDRGAAVARRLALLAEAEAALAVNNNAAALLLALAALARGREVVVSRGELVEIGGSFRLPEILEGAGVRLVEVGTTNRTHPEDYRRAIGPGTALLLKVHRSNFEQRGFVAEVDVATLAGIARERAIPLIEDLGSGTLVDLRGRGLPEESFAPARLRLGADVVCFSGDKLLGGPQAGILLGRAALVAAMRAHPLARAVRLDRMTLAALDWTLGALLAGELDRIPLLRQLEEPDAAVRARAEGLAERLAPLAAAAGLALAVEPSRAPVGGGSLPGFELASWAVALRAPAAGSGVRAPAPDHLAARLRAAPVPVVARVTADAVLLDARTLLAGDDADIAAALAAALIGPQGSGTVPARDPRC
jgi:L-seryl-tRNA(Ser) seleniumtransferase